jgi:hypothetical protein
MNERWKIIEGFSAYEVSDLGRQTGGFEKCT